MLLELRGDFRSRHDRIFGYPSQSLKSLERNKSSLLAFPKIYVEEIIGIDSDLFEEAPEISATNSLSMEIVEIFYF